MFDTVTRQRLGRPHRRSDYQGEVQIQNLAQENRDGFYQLIPIHHNNMNQSLHQDPRQSNTSQEQYMSSINTGRRPSRREECSRQDYERMEEPQRYNQPHILHQNTQNHHKHPATRQVKSHDGYTSFKQQSSHRSSKSAPSQTVRSPPSIASEQTMYEQPQNIYSQPKQQQPLHYNNENHVIFYQKPLTLTRPQTKHQRKTVQEIPYEHFKIQPIKPPTFQTDQSFSTHQKFETTPSFANNMQQPQQQERAHNSYNGHMQNVQERSQKRIPLIYDQVDEGERVTQKPPQPSKLALAPRNSAPPVIKRQSPRKHRTPSMTFGDDFEISSDAADNGKIETFRIRRTDDGGFNWESGDEERRGLPFPTDDQLKMMLTDGQKTMRSSLKKSQGGRHGTVRKRVTIQERIPSQQALLFP